MADWEVQHVCQLRDQYDSAYECDPHHETCTYANDELPCTVQRSCIVLRVKMAGISCSVDEMVGDSGA